MFCFFVKPKNLLIEPNLSIFLAADVVWEAAGVRLLDEIFFCNCTTESRSLLSTRLASRNFNFVNALIIANLPEEKVIKKLLRLSPKVQYVPGRDIDRYQFSNFSWNHLYAR